jgi:hypothetical protein
MRRFFLLMLLLPSVNLYAASNYPTCEFAMEELRSEQMARLARLEESFMKTTWHYRKYQGIVYEPLWRAAKNKNDRFSKEKRAEGEVAYDRYRSLADGEHDEAQKQFRMLHEILRNLQASMPRDYACRGVGESSPDKISDFGNCMEIFLTETGDRFNLLQRLFSDYYKNQESFSEMVEEHLADNLSDHDTFDDRFRDYLFTAVVKTQSEFLRVTEDLDERFERKWPGKECCAACAKDKTMDQDAVLSEVKLDPQGATGAAGNVVNNARIGDAFARFDEEAKKEKA